MSVTNELTGSIVPIVTPVRPDGRFDTEACGRMVGDLLARNVGGIVALGTTGEFSLVPPSMRGEILQLLNDTIDGRVPLIACCGRPSVEETADEIKAASDLGADYCLVAPSYYFSLRTPEILREFETLGRVTDKRLLYYHIPIRTSANNGVEIIRALHGAGLIGGIKDSGGANPQFLEAMLEISDSDPEFQFMLGGSSSLVHAAAHGVRCVTSATGCIAPEIEQAVFEHVTAGRFAEAAKAQRKLVQLIALILSANAENAAVGTKALASLRGICGPTPLPPFAAADDEWMAAAQGKLDNILSEA